MSCWSGRYVVTHGLDAVVTRGSNTYGPYHHPEKLIPLFITNAHRRPAPAALRRRAPATRLAVRRRPRRGASTTCCVRRAGETYNIAGRRRAGQPRRRRAAARPARQAVVARPPGRGPARPRPPLRDGRREARGARLAAADVVRGRAGADGRLVRRQRGVVARGIAPATGTPTTSGSTGRVWRSGRRLRGRRHGLMRVAVTARRRPGHRPGRCAVHRPFRPDRMDTARVRPRRARRPSDACSTGTGRRSWSTPRPGPTSTAVPATRSWRCGGMGTPTGVVARGHGRTGIDLDRTSGRTRCSTGDATDDRGYRPDDAAVARESLRRVQAGRRGGRPDGRMRGHPLALAIARTAWLYGPPGNDFPRKILSRRGGGREPASRSASSATSGVSPTYAADVAEAIVELIGSDSRWRRGHPSFRERRRRDARGLGARRAPPLGFEVDVAEVPALDLGACIDATPLGRPRARRPHRAASRCGRGNGDGRLRPAAPPAAQAAAR